MLRLSSEALIKGAGETDRALDWAKDRIGVRSDRHRVERGAGRGRGACRRATAETSPARPSNTRLPTLLRDSSALGVRRLVVAGGETSGAAVDRLGVSAFRLGPEIAPGVPLMRTVGREGGELQMALKSGNFGGRDFFTRALAMTR